MKHFCFWLELLLLVLPKLFQLAQHLRNFHYHPNHQSHQILLKMIPFQQELFLIEQLILQQPQQEPFQLEALMNHYHLSQNQIQLSYFFKEQQPQHLFFKPLHQYCQYLKRLWVSYQSVLAQHQKSYLSHYRIHLNRNLSLRLFYQVSFYLQFLLLVLQSFSYLLSFLNHRYSIFLMVVQNWKHLLQQQLSKKEGKVRKCRIK